MTARHAQALEALLVDEGFDGDVYPNEPMARHTTYRIGGPARFYVCVGSIGALKQVVEVCEEEGVPWEVVGKGSNLLVSDEGYPGVIMTLGRDFRAMRFEEESNRLAVGAGVSLSAAVQEAYIRSMAGLEFAVGTPGTIGGALRMNAGTRTEWISQSVVSVTTLRRGEGLRRWEGDDLVWGYRTSPFASDDIILECELQLEPADPVYIRGKMEARLSRRRKSQPLSQPSCGSVFRNPDGMSVGEMIERVGLKGAAVGGARISEVHSNFIVNDGGAAASDVRALMDMVKTKVSQAYGIELQPEVRFLGFA